jgi:hypothetical protein
LFGCAPGVALVAGDVVVVDVDALVEVDVFWSSDFFSEPQPTSARLSTTVAVAAVMYFICCISPKLYRRQRQPRRNETS